MSIAQSSVSNLLLRSLSPGDYGVLQPCLARVRLQQGEFLFKSGRPIEQVHFPEGGVCSVVAEQERGEMIEVGLYGREGMSGSAVVLGAGQTPNASMVQVGNPDALAIASDRLLEACDESPSLLRVLLRFAQVFAVQSALTAASNAHQALPERLARWLLMCHDRVAGDRIDLTHDFISTMLAVRRSSVTVTLHTLEGVGAIRATRGVVAIVERARLEEIAGVSYGAAEREYRRLIGPFGKSGGDIGVQP